MIEQYLPSLYRVGGGSWGVGAACLSIEGDSNVYLLKTNEGAMLVDCATEEGTGKIEANLRQAGVEPEAVTDLVLTHSHHDHSAAAATWQKRGASVHLNAVEADWLRRGDWRLLGYRGPGHAPEHRGQR